MLRSTILVNLVFISAACARAQPPEPTMQPLVRVVDLNIGHVQHVELADGRNAVVKLLEVKETADPIREAIRQARVRVVVNGQSVWLASANYNLPITVAGVRIDCPLTKGYLANSRQDAWGLERDARLRLWPAGAPLVAPGTFIYPARQRWFASATQMANEPVYVDGGEVPKNREIYYHYGLDIGGCEGMVEVVAATDGLVVSAGTDVLPGFTDTPVRPRYDVVYLLDSRGWYYRYSHLHTIAEALRPGQRVTMGQRVGVLGKEGASGGWSHLHFDIKIRQPTGKWGTHEGYAFLWEAYLRQYQPKLIAVARPHQLARTGDKVMLDAGRSWSAAGKITSYEWTFTDGRSVRGAHVDRISRIYQKAGTYSEILKVTDAAGRVDYDFAIVNVIERKATDQVPPTIHATYAPTFGIRPGDPVTFKVRSFRTTEGEETWDFGDGTPPVTVKSDGNVKALAKDGYAVTTHRFQNAGQYVVRVQRTNARGETAIGHVLVRVGKNGEI